MCVCTHLSVLTVSSFFDNRNKDCLYYYTAYHILAIVLRDIHYYLFDFHNNPIELLLAQKYSVI